MATETVTKLLALQLIDQQLNALKLEAKELPARKNKIEVRLQQGKEALATAKDDCKHIQVEIKEAEITIETYNERINKYRKQQMDVKHNEEYRTLENEIRTVRDDIRGLEDQELVLMEKLETQQATLVEREAELAAKQAEVDRDQGTIEERLATVLVEIKALEEERAGHTEGVDQEWMSRYERTISHTKDTALVSTRNGICGGCFMQIPPHLVHDSKHPDSMTLCTYCGRMLYFEA